MIFAVQSGITWSLLPLLAALTAVTGAGSFLVRLLRVDDESSASTDRNSVRQPTHAAWGWSYVLGMALIGLLLQLPLAVDGRITHRSFFGVLAVCAAMTIAECFLRWRENLDRHKPSDRRWQSWFRALAGWTADLPKIIRLMTLVCLGIFLWFAAIKPSITYDARSIFGLKARVLYDTGTLDSEDFRDPDRLNFNANYSLLVPVIEATLFAAQGSLQNVGLQLLFAGFVLASASLLAAEVRRFDSRAAAAMWGACFLLLPLTLAPTEGGGLSGSADYAFAALATAAVIAMRRWLDTPSFRNGLLAGLLFGAASLTKQEALIWLAAVAIAVIATKRMRRLKFRWSALKTGSIIVLVTFGCLAIAALNRCGIPQSPYFRPFSGALRLDWLIHVWSRIPFVVQFAVRELGDGRLFGSLWPLCIFTLLLLRRPAASAQVIFYRWSVAGVAVAYFVAFTLTPLHLEYQLRSAFFRLAVHFLPLLMLAAAEQLAASGWSRQVQGLFTGLDAKQSGSQPQLASATDLPGGQNKSWTDAPPRPARKSRPARAA